ncbi:MAG: c-type cytochrome [Deltaproteobacteria bacterium]|nr:c-type cytochrome [Deltaproteobacteria bacterium]
MSDARIRRYPLSLALAPLMALTGWACKDPPAPVAVPPPAPPNAAPVDLAALEKTAGRHWPLDRRAAAIAEGKAALHRHQCTRCHTLDGLPSHGRPNDCVKCHTFLLDLPNQPKRYQDIASRHGEAILQRYLSNLEHLLQVPDLSRLGARVRPDWIGRYVKDPFDLRPHASESMIRTALTHAETKQIARYFAAVADVPDPAAPEFAAEAPPPKPSPERLAQGKALFASKACATCHAFGTVAFDQKPAAPVRGKPSPNDLAPNLRFVRDRMAPSVVVAWLVNPQSVQADAKMPRLGLTQGEAEVLRDWLFHADPALQPAPTALPAVLPPAATRPVGWAEVKERVLGKVCVHCHMNEHENDTGPGNGGGLGYAGLGLSFRTYERAVFGARGKQGDRYSVFEVLPGETMPRILATMVQRRVEHLRDNLPPGSDWERPPFPQGLLGMPMGLPAMTDQELGLLRAWIEQGCPGPTEVTGKPGFNDGFLVPDGPVAVNHGCQVRAPLDPPPAWSYEASRRRAPEPHAATPSAATPTGH